MKVIDCETVFNTAEKTMIQTFDNGVQLITDIPTGITGVFVNNELKEKYQYMPIVEYMELQLKVQELKNPFSE